MPSVFNYTISGDFPNGLSQAQFEQEILDETGITTLLLGVTVIDDEDVVVEFISDLSLAEEALLQDIVDNHIPTDPGDPVSSTSSLVTYNILTDKYRAIDTTFRTISRFSWLNSRYNTFTEGKVIINVDIFGNNMDVRLYDGSTSLGSLIASTSGIKTFNITIPNSDKLLELQIKKASDGGVDPEIKTGVLEFIS